MNPVLALIIANVIWGAASPIFKLALTNIPPFTLGAIRFLGASLIFLPFAIKKWQKLDKNLTLEIAIGSLAIFVNIIFFFLGLEKTQSINGPIIGSMQPVFLYIFAILFLRERAHKRIILSIIVAFAGILIIVLTPLILDHGITIVQKKEEMIGNVFLVISTLGAVINTMYFKNVLKKININQLTFMSFMICGLTFLLYVPLELSHWSLSSLNINGWIGIFFGLFLSSALAYFLYDYGISKIDAQEVGVFTYVDPVAAILIAVPLLHEYPNVYFFIGSFLVFGGIFIAEGRIHWHPFHRLNRKISNF